jgi:tRNA splicing endonuclease
MNIDESQIITGTPRFRIIRNLGGAFLCAPAPRETVDAAFPIPVPCQHQHVVANSSDPDAESLTRMAARVVSLSRRVPSAAADDTGMTLDDDSVVFAPEELQLLDAAGLIVGSSSWARENVHPTTPAASPVALPATKQSLRAAAYRWLLTHGDVVPRCDAAGFGADFLCYRDGDAHACALAWIISSCPNGVGDLPAHRAVGYKRLAQTVRKEAWLLLPRGATPEFECHIL